jgi:hypothetical protein
VSPAYDAETIQVPSSPDPAVYVIEHEATAAGPLRTQETSEASEGRPDRAIDPVIDWESPWSLDVTVTVQVVVTPFQSMLDGEQRMEVEVSVVIVKLEAAKVELAPW